MTGMTSSSAARPTAFSSTHLDESTIGRLAALGRSLQSPQTTPAPRPGRKTAQARGGTFAQNRAFRRTQAIRARYADGEPLAPADLAFMRKVLAKHPRAAEKIGPGVQEILVGAYVSDTRCFWALRTDGSIVDFSARACLGQPKARHTPRLLALMARFSTEPLRRAFRAHLAAGQTGAGVTR